MILVGSSAFHSPGKAIAVKKTDTVSARIENPGAAVAVKNCEITNDHGMDLYFTPEFDERISDSVESFNDARLTMAEDLSGSFSFRAASPGDSVLRIKRVFKNYKGKPWNNQPQEIPGKIQCEFYDLGGEGIAYHDMDSINNGSGKLNPADGTFLNEFRMKEGVDISYTKTRDIDSNPYNIVEPLMDQLYVGWTHPGEWINYTVKIDQSGKYEIGLMYTASGDGGISFLLDGKKLTHELLIPSTRNDKEPVSWRQWHHWNRVDSLVKVNLRKGLHVLTLRIVTHGNMNFDFLNFKLENQTMVKNHVDDFSK